MDDTGVKLGIRAKLLIIFVIALTVVLTAAGGISLYRFSNTAERLQNRKLDSDIFSITEKAGHVIETDDITTLVESGEEGDALYNKIRDQLVDISQSNPNVESNRIYVAIPGENPDEVIFVVDTEDDPEERFALREVYTPSEGERMIAAFEENQIDDSYLVIETDEGDAYFATGYGPLKDADGNTVAIIGVEMLAASVFEVRRDVLSMSLTTAVVVSPLIISVVFLISGRLSRPILDITEVARKLERNERVDPDILRDEVRRNDELGQLARVFSRMAKEVQAREERLKQQVAELKVEVDFMKQKAQVDEITDSDFFRQLQAQKAKLRDRRGQQASDEESDKPADE